MQSVLVAEIYGPDYDRQMAIAREVRRLFETTGGVVDVDDYLEADQVKYVFTVDRAKAALAGIPSEEIVKTLRLALQGANVGLVHIPKEKRPVQMMLRLPLTERTGLEHLGEISLRTAAGHMVPLSELIREERSVREKSDLSQESKAGRLCPRGCRRRWRREG